MAGRHLRPLRLFEISQDKVKPNEDEKQHVRECAECQTIIVILVRQFSPQHSPFAKPETAA